MKHVVIGIGRWVVDFLFSKEDYDIDGVLACLYDADANDAVLEQAEKLMLDCDYNCGFTYSDQIRKRAVVLVGPTTSGEEFLDSFVHETRHLADAIANSLGVPLDSELPAYISGDAARYLAEIICDFGCR